MPSFREIIATHGPVLVLDAASARVQVGFCRAGSAGTWYSADDEAGVALFQGVHDLAVRLDEVRAFVFCEGPGSVLGIRTAAMALRTWNVLQPRPMFAYSSLALVAHALRRANAGVIADARRDAWHHYTLGGVLRRLPASELNGELVMPDNFRHWSTLPSNVARVPYSVAEMLQSVGDANLFHATEAPDAFLHEEPNYVTWTPQVHRAPIGR